jgi:hypothetical protein
MPLEAGSRAAHLAAVKAAKTRWGGKKSHKKEGKKKGKKGMSHAKAVAAGKKAARTRKKNKD